MEALVIASVPAQVVEVETIGNDQIETPTPGKGFARVLDPLWPAVDVVAVLDAPTSAAPRPTRAARPVAVRPLMRLRDAPGK